MSIEICDGISDCILLLWWIAPRDLHQDLSKLSTTLLTFPHWTGLDLGRKGTFWNAHFWNVVVNIFALCNKVWYQSLFESFWLCLCPCKRTFTLVVLILVSVLVLGLMKRPFILLFVLIGAFGFVIWTSVRFDVFVNTDVDINRFVVLFMGFKLSHRYIQARHLCLPRCSAWSQHNVRFNCLVCQSLPCCSAWSCCQGYVSSRFDGCLWWSCLQVSWSLCRDPVSRLYEGPLPGWSCWAVLWGSEIIYQSGMSWPGLGHGVNRA